MAYLDISSKSVSILRNTDGADDPDQLVGVAAGELFQWGWLIGEPACWLADAHTRADVDRSFDGYRAADTTAWLGTHIAEQGQP